MVSNESMMSTETVLFGRLSALVLAAGLSMGAWNELQAEEAAGTPETQGWELFINDDFGRDETGGDWEVVEGEWSVDDGHLNGQGVIRTSRRFFDGVPRDLPGEHPAYFQRIEVEVAPAEDGSPGTAGFFIHTKVLEDDEEGCMSETGYYLQIGPDAVLTRLGKEMWSAEGIDLPESGAYTVTLENDEGTVRVYVEDEVVFEEREMFSVLARDRGWLGFKSDSPIRVGNVVIYVKPLDDDYI